MDHPPVLGRMTPVPGNPFIVTSNRAPSNGLVKGLPRIETVRGALVKALAARPAGV